MPTPSTNSEEVLWDNLLGLIEKVVQKGERYDVCGVGCGGPMTQLNFGFAIEYSSMASFPLLKRLKEL